MQTQNSRLYILAEAPVGKAIFTMAMPVMFGMLVQVFYNMVDTFFIGKMNDVNQLAAAGISFPFFMFMMACGSVIGVGGASLISRYLGMKKFEEAGQVVSLSMILILIMAAVLTVAGLIFLDPIAALIGAQGEVIAPTKAYILPIILGSVCFVGNYALSIILRAEGAALPAMKGMLIGTVVNIILNPIMIFAFNWKIAGSAWATIVGNLAGLIYYLKCYIGPKSILQPSFRGKLFHAEYLRGIFSIGVPSGLNMALMSVAGVVTNNLAATYGAIILAAMGISGRVTSLIILLLVGLAIGCQPLIGFNYGAKNKKRLYEILKTSMVIAVIAGTALLVLFTLLRTHAIAAFTNIPEVVDKGSFILLAMSISAPVIGVIMICMNSLQSLGKAIPSLILSTGRQGIFYIPLLFLLNGLFGFHGLIFTQAIVDVLMCVTATAMLLYVLKTDPVLHPERSKKA